MAARMVEKIDSWIAIVLGKHGQDTSRSILSLVVMQSKDKLLVAFQEEWNVKSSFYYHQYFCNADSEI